MADPAAGAAGLAAASGLVDLVAAALLVNGAAFLGFGTLGVLRFPEVFNKLHAQTKATTLGIGSILLAFAVLALPAPAGTQALAGILFIVLTAPAAATAIGSAALKAGRGEVIPWEGGAGETPGGATAEATVDEEE